MACSQTVLPVVCLYYSRVQKSHYAFKIVNDIKVALIQAA